MHGPIYATFLTAASAAPAQFSNASREYDFIVVGGGTSGLVIANRLSEDPSISIAIIEAGDSVFNNTNVTSTSGYGLAFGTSIDWGYESTPQVFAGNYSQTLRAGRALGGTSTINGMTYMRAETGQIDAFSKVGNSLTWDSLLPYYEKSEGFQVPTAAQLEDGASYDAEVHGFDGPLTVGWPSQMVENNFSETLNATFESVGLPWNGEPNSGYMRGYNIFPKTLDPALNIREDAARAYYLPIKVRPNLDLYLNAFAERLTWRDDGSDAEPSADGVIFTSASDQKQQLLAKKEIVLSAGALRSPLLLEQSGVGNAKILGKHGIEVQVDLPFVGENLQDQTTTDTAYTAKQNFTGGGGFIGYYNANDVFGNSTNAVKAKVNSALPSYAQQIVEASGNIVSQTVIEELLDIQHKIIFDEKAVISEVIVNAPSSGSASLEYWGLIPFSRGSIHIQSANASAPAVINPNYFMLDWDVKQQVGTAEVARAVANTSPFKDLLGEETTPGLATVPANASETIWADWLKLTYRSNFHYISTAAMMSRELGGVVDDTHLVYGTANVRVVDASVLPFQVSGHLTSTLYALAERAADVIKARYA
ncbi:Glucose oxidase [Pseudocercospora fuligena]|uniref:Glucose oxidase n=1 Tax=Pseudocercospora fuligena TaxID=685502 RepID=A0A8H6VCV0_9PEZI|nr:Glucose oxidase [Pseudocercospora fuligena]